MFMLKSIKLFSILSISIAISACGGGSSESRLDSLDDNGSALDGYDDSQSALDGYDDNQSLLDQINGAVNNPGSGSGTDTGNSTKPPLTYLNCDALDPDKIYLLGSLTPPGDSPLYAIIDIEDPTDFCVALDNKALSYHISDGGELFYKRYQDNQIFKFVQEPLGTNSDNNWRYPSDSVIRANEVPIMFARNEADEYLAMRFNPETGANDFYHVDSQDGGFDWEIYVNEETIAYVSLDNWRRIYGVFPDGSLILSSSTRLFFLDTNKITTELDNPVEGQWYVIGKPRIYNDSETGSPRAWIMVTNDDSEERRWSFDPSTLTLNDEGTYSEIPTGLEENITDTRVFDTAGNLIQTVLINNDSSPDPYFIIRRSLVSSGEGTVILRGDTDETIPFPANGLWYYADIPYVFTTYYGTLITGD